VPTPTYSGSRLNPLPQLVDTPRGCMESITGLHQNICRACNQFILRQQPIDTGFRDKVLMFVGNVPRQLPRRFLQMRQGLRDVLLFDTLGKPIPEPPGSLAPWSKAITAQHSGHNFPGLSATFPEDI